MERDVDASTETRLARDRVAMVVLGATPAMAGPSSRGHRKPVPTTTTTATTTTTTSSPPTTPTSTLPPKNDDSTTSTSSSTTTTTVPNGGSDSLNNFNAIVSYLQTQVPCRVQLASGSWTTTTDWTADTCHYTAGEWPSTGGSVVIEFRYTGWAGDVLEQGLAKPVC